MWLSEVNHVVRAMQRHSTQGDGAVLAFQAQQNLTKCGLQMPEKTHL